MIPALRHFEYLRIALSPHSIDQPVFLCNPARPPALQIAAQGFRFAGSAKGCAAAFFRRLSSISVFIRLSNLRSLSCQ